MPIFTPGDLVSFPPPELHLGAGPGIQSVMLRHLLNAVRAYRQRSDQTADVRPSLGARPIPDARSRAARLKGDSASSLTIGTRHSREAQMLSLDEEDATLGGATESMKTLIETVRAPPELRA